MAISTPAPKLLLLLMGMGGLGFTFSIQSMAQDTTQAAPAGAAPTLPVSPAEQVAPKESGAPQVSSPPEDMTKIRDPFRKPEALYAKLAIRTELEYFPATAYQILAIVTGPSKMRALVKSPDGKTHFVAENMKIGQRNGVVRKITIDSILVREKIVNVVGQEENVDTELKLVVKN